MEKYSGSGRKANPNPQGVNRNFSCPRYNDCLTRAVRESWAGFSCDACGLRNHGKKDRSLLDAPDYDPEADCNFSNERAMSSGEKVWETVLDLIGLRI